jgi:hypothetical protein
MRYPAERKEAVLKKMMPPLIFHWLQKCRELIALSSPNILMGQTVANLPFIAWPNSISQLRSR